MVNLTINGQSVVAAKGALLLDVCRNSGIDIPTLCHLPDLPSYGACRLCTVEVTQGGRTRLTASCCQPVSDGIAVQTDTERVQNGRRVMGELLLASCPGNDAVKEIVGRLGVTGSRFVAEAPELAPVVEEDEEEEEAAVERHAANEAECILCGLCVRACTELAGVYAIEFAGRGDDRRVTTAFDTVTRTCVGCGACSYVCPTGAIDMEGPALVRFRESSAEQRYCRYARMGIVSQKICPNDYRCGQCEYDQEMEDLMGSHPVLAAKPARQRQLQVIEGISYMPDYAYHPQGHMWVRQLGPVLRVGIDGFRAAFISGVKRINLPEPGSQVTRGEAGVGIEHEGKPFDLVYPVSGEMVAVNHDLAINPELMIHDPYGRGWLLLIRPQNVELELQYLIRKLGVPTWFTRERRRLRDCLPPGFEHSENLGATLGEMNAQTLDQIAWEFFPPVRPGPMARRVPGGAVIPPLSRGVN